MQGPALPSLKLSLCLWMARQRYSKLDEPQSPGACVVRDLRAFLSLGLSMQGEPMASLEEPIVSVWVSVDRMGQRLQWSLI